MNLPLLTVINSSGQVPDEYPWWKKWILRLAFKAIRAYQSDKYSSTERVNAVHSVIHLGNGWVLDVTWPRAVIHKFEPQPGVTYTYWVWTGADKLDADAMGDAKEAANRFAGNGYDWLQLFGIGFQRVFYSLLVKILPPPYNAELGKLISFRTLLGLGKTQTVCCAGSHAVALAAYKSLKWRGIEVDRPLGDQWVEATCPADFEHSPTFRQIEVYP